MAKSKWIRSVFVCLLIASISVKSLATSVVSAGLTNGISNQLGIEHKDVAKLSFKDHLNQAARENAIGAACHTTASSVIQGGSVGENALNAVRSAAVDTAAAPVAHAIGNAYHGTTDAAGNVTAPTIGAGTQKTLHAGLGAAAAAAKGQSALAGATGAVIGETVAEFAARNAIEKASVSAAKGAQDEAIQRTAENGRPLTKEEFESIYQKHLKDDFKSELKNASRIGQIAGAAGAFAVGQNAMTGLDAAGNATRNNCELSDISVLQQLDGSAPEIQESTKVLAQGCDAAWEEYKRNPVFRGAVDIGLCYAGVGYIKYLAKAGLIGAAAVSSFVLSDQLATDATMVYTGENQRTYLSQGLDALKIPPEAQFATTIFLGNPLPLYSLKGVLPFFRNAEQGATRSFIQISSEAPSAFNTTSSSFFAEGKPLTSRSVQSVPTNTFTEIQGAGSLGSAAASGAKAEAQAASFVGTRMASEATAATGFTNVEASMSSTTSAAKTAPVAIEAASAPTVSSEIKGSSSAAASMGNIETKAAPEVTQATEQFPFVNKINGQRPLNYKYAGETYPMEKLPHKVKNPITQETSFVRGSYPDGVPFNQQGFPDFSRYTKAQVKIELTGNRDLDAKLCNQIMGWTKTPKGYTWHHNEQPGIMQLVPRNLHKALDHTGGMAVFKSKNP